MFDTETVLEATHVAKVLRAAGDIARVTVGPTGITRVEVTRPDGKHIIIRVLPAGMR